MLTENRRLLVATGIFHPESGGPATYLYELLPHVQSHGWQVQVITYGDAPQQSTDYPYPVQRIPRRALPLRLFDYAHAAYSALDSADVVYVHTLGLPLLPRGHAARILKIVGDQAWERAIRKGWIAPTEDIDHFQTQRYSPIVTAQQAVRTREARSMDAIIVPSQYLKRMVTGWGVEPARIHVIYNALPPAKNAAPLTQAAARAQLGLGDQPLLLTAARLNPWKGVGPLIQALAYVPDVHLLVAGDGPEAPGLRERAAALNLTGRVTFLGNVPREKLDTYMHAADYFALYSGYEGLSHALLESLRAGTPVIASDKGGNPEVVTHDVNGLLVPYVDIPALSAALETAFAPGKRAQLAAQTALGLERFNFQTMLDQTLAVLEAHLSQR